MGIIYYKQSSRHNLFTCSERQLGANTPQCVARSIRANFNERLKLNNQNLCNNGSDKDDTPVTFNKLQVP